MPKQKQGRIGKVCTDQFEGGLHVRCQQPRPAGPTQGSQVRRGTPRVPRAIISPSKDVWYTPGVTANEALRVEAS